MDAGRRPLLLANGLGGHLADAHHGDPLVKYEIDGAAAVRTGKKASELIRRNRWVAGGIALALVVVFTLLAVDFKDGSRETEQVPHYEDSGEDPYKEDVSWIKNTEKRFRDEERLREKQIELAKREELRYNKLKLRLQRRGNKQPLPAKKTFVIPPSAFPEFHPKPRKTEAEREAERETAKREEERRQEEEDALRREVEAAEYKYLLEGRVEPPLSSVPNCVNCEEVEPPSECSKSAFTLASNVREDVPLSAPLLASPHSLAEPLHNAEASDRRRRKLLFALKPKAPTDQVPFEEPTGIAKSIVGRLLSDWKEDPGCAFWTRKCVRKSQREINVLPFDKGPEELFVDHILPQSGDRLFPNLQEGDLGICAVVGSGANLKGTGRGKQIDGHETVFRFLDAPTEGYEDDVGNKTTVAVIKAGMSIKPEVLKRLRDSKDTVTHYHFERLRDWKNLAAEEDEEEFTFFGKELLWATELSEQATSKLYKMHLAGTRSSHPSHIKHMPTSGFRLVTALIASRLCLRVDVYGVSAAGGGHYHAPGDYISRSHVLGLEQWLPRLAMKEEMGVCVYD